MDAQKEIEQLATDFEQCRKVLIALEDEESTTYDLGNDEDEELLWSTCK